MKTVLLNGEEKQGINIEQPNINTIPPYFNKKYVPGKSIGGVPRVRFSYYLPLVGAKTVRKNLLLQDGKTEPDIEKGFNGMVEKSMKRKMDIQRENNDLFQKAAEKYFKQTDHRTEENVTMAEAAPPPNAPKADLVSIMPIKKSSRKRKSKGPAKKAYKKPLKSPFRISSKK